MNVKAFFLLLACINVVCATNAQQKNAIIANYHLTIPIPDGYSIMPVDEANELHKQGVQIVKNELGEDIKIIIETLLILKKNDDNQLIAETQPFITNVLGNYDSYRVEMNHLFYKTIAENISPGTIDTFYSKKKVGNKDFECLKSIIKLPDGTQRNIAVIKQLLGNEQLSFTLIYTDELHEKVLLDALKNSSFSEKGKKKD